MSQQYFFLTTSFWKASMYTSSEYIQFGGGSWPRQPWKKYSKANWIISPQVWGWKFQQSVKLLPIGQTNVLAFIWGLKYATIRPRQCSRNAFKNLNRATWNKPWHDIPLDWLFHRDPYDGLYNLLYTANSQGFGRCSTELYLTCMVSQLPAHSGPSKWQWR